MVVVAGEGAFFVFWKGGQLQVPFSITNGQIAFILFDLTSFDCWLNHIQNTAEKKVKFPLNTIKNQRASDLRKLITFDTTIPKIYLLWTILTVPLLQYTCQL